MDRKSFKIGDKVKISSYSATYDYELDEHLYNEGIIGTVIGVSRSVRVKWDTNRCVVCGLYDCGCVVKTWHHKPHEIEHAVKIGEQLMFAFMRTSD